MTEKHMKAMEREWTLTLPAHGYKVLRLDGRGFSRWTKKFCEKPFDMDFVAAMNRTAQELCTEIQGARFAYVQSDEISVLIADLDPKSQQWFGGDVSKTCSVSASIASNMFNQWFGLRADADDAQFDARVFAVPNRLDVERYFLWRQRDCFTNAVGMLASAHFSHKELMGVGVYDRVEELRKKGILLTDFYSGLFEGRLVFPVVVEEDVFFTHKKTGERVNQTVRRTRWIVEECSWFDWDERSYLADLIP